jgi:hypothetical protein
VPGLAYSPEYARRLADRIGDEFDGTVRVLVSKECYEAMSTVYYDFLATVYGMLIDHLVMGRDIGMMVRDYEKALEVRIKKLREMGAEEQREARRLEKMRITDAVGKKPEEITLGDMISLFKTLAGKLLVRCFYEYLGRTAGRERGEERG